MHGVIDLGVFNNNLTTDNRLTFYETYTPDRSVFYNILFSENPKITTEKKIIIFRSILFKAMSET